MTRCDQISLLGQIPGHDGVTFPAVFGWRHTADCTCSLMEGIRLDKDEPILVGSHCLRPGHEEKLNDLEQNIVSDAEGSTRGLHEVVEERFAMWYAEVVA